MFLTSRDEFQDFCRGRKRLLMADFYKQRRIAAGILVDSKGMPTGGRWSFDTENRKKLPKTVTPPPVSAASATGHVKDVIQLVAERFPTHPGSAADFWWPTTREQARAWLGEFIEERLTDFGPYEDAISTRTDTLFHSLLSPMLNIGLLTPEEVLGSALEFAESRDTPLPSLEGFVRQVMGWREFIRGIYREYGDEQETANYWGHDRELCDSWYEATTGIAPLDHAIDVSNRLGWAHHIQRLMVAANLMTLCEIRPRSSLALVHGDVRRFFGVGHGPECLRDGNLQRRRGIRDQAVHLWLQLPAENERLQARRLVRDGRRALLALHRQEP